MPGTRATPVRRAALVASSQPPTVSWSVMASTSMPAAAAASTSTVGLSVPSLTVEWACRSMTGPLSPPGRRALPSLVTRTP